MTLKTIRPQIGLRAYVAGLTGPFHKRINMAKTTPDGFFTTTEASKELLMTYSYFMQNVLPKMETYQPYKRGPHLISVSELDKMKKRVRIFMGRGHGGSTLEL